MGLRTVKRAQRHGVESECVRSARLQRMWQIWCFGFESTVAQLRRHTPATGAESDRKAFEAASSTGWRSRNHFGFNDGRVCVDPRLDALHDVTASSVPEERDPNCPRMRSVHTPTSRQRSKPTSRHSQESKPSSNGRTGISGSKIQGHRFLAGLGDTTMSASRAGGHTKLSGASDEGAQAAPVLSDASPPHAAPPLPPSRLSGRESASGSSFTLVPLRFIHESHPGCPPTDTG